MKPMKLIPLLALLALPLLAQDKPKDAPAQPFMRIEPKARRLTEGETREIEYLKLRYENLARAMCESIDVKYQNCDIQQGLVMEKPKTPAPVATPEAEKKDKK
jgi:hypothetical protein